MGQYLPILTMTVLGALFAGLSFFASKLLAPKRPTEAKAAPYECGIVPDREPVERFPVSFYLIAMIFIVVDIEVIFLFPWAVLGERLGIFGLVEMLAFTLVVVVALVYLLANGALSWGPRKHEIANNRRRFDPSRTAQTTVRRVGRSEMQVPATDPEAA